MTSTPKLTIRSRPNFNQTLNLSALVKKSPIKQTFGQTMSIRGTSPKIRLNMPSTGGSPLIPDSKANVSFKKASVKIATVSLSLNQSYRSVSRPMPNLPIRVVRDVMPCPDLILLNT